MDAQNVFRTSVVQEFIAVVYFSRFSSKHQSRRFEQAGNEF
jgi:hypothetical protein